MTSLTGNNLSVVNNLEYWIFSPFVSENDLDSNYAKKIKNLIEVIKTNAPNSEEYDRTLQAIEDVYSENKTQYEYVARRQIEKAINQMRTKVMNRMISQTIVPVATKVAETVMPVVKDTLNNKVLPAGNKALSFLHRTFVKKKIEVVETKPSTEE